MDSHFTSSYDPQADVHPDSETEDDWAQALEGLKDRHRWMQKGAERLREAGFSEEQVTKWEKGGQRNEEDVRWSKTGEGREWDRGKVLDMDDVVGLEAKPQWGRLKGS